MNADAQHRFTAAVDELHTVQCFWRVIADLTTPGGSLNTVDRDALAVVLDDLTRRQSAALGRLHR